MFKNPPKIIAHHSAVSVENFVTSEYILHQSDNRVKLLNRFCPHRMYPLAQPGNLINQLTCKFHGFAWGKDGTPINNDKNIHCGTTDVSSSGLITKNFTEPNHRWVTDLANETNLKYSHSMNGSSKGSWNKIWAGKADMLSSNIKINGLILSIFLISKFLIIKYRSKDKNISIKIV